MSKKIYIGNLPFSTVDGELHDLFAQYGTVESVHLITDRDTGRPRGFGFVDMSDGADEAIEALHRSSFGGRTINVNEARPRINQPAGAGWDLTPRAESSSPRSLVDPLKLDVTDLQPEPPGEEAATLVLERSPASQKEDVTRPTSGLAAVVADLLQKGNFEQILQIAEAQKDAVAEDPALQKLIEEARSRVESDASLPDSLEARVDALEQELAQIRDQLTESSRWPERFRDLQIRVERAAESTPSDTPPAWHSLSAEELRARLGERGFFLTLPVAEVLWSALRRKRIVVLEGVPGTGKSMLAKLLPEILLEPHSESGKCFSEINAHPELSVEDFIGGRTITHNNRVGPACGPLFDAVLCCHESPDGYWLLLDEFNRCSIDVIFAPLLDAMARPDGTVQHPYMFPDRADEEARIAIPPEFRILGTMNPLDRGLFEISQALLQRIQIVTIPTLRGEEEFEMIQTRVLEPWLSDTAGSNRSPWQDLAADAGRRLQQIAEQVRDLAARPPTSQFAPCELGSRLIMAAMQGFLIRLETDEEITRDGLDAVLDGHMRDEFLSQLKACGTDALEALLSEVFPESDFPQTSEALKSLLEMRRVF